MSSFAKATGWRRPTRRSIWGRIRPIWWCCRFPTATLALSRRAGTGRERALPGAAARQPRGAAPSVVGRYLCRTDAVGREGHPDPADRRRELLVLWSCAGAGSGAAARHRAGGAAGRRARRMRGSMRFPPCRSRPCGGCRRCAMPAARWRPQAALAQLALAAGLYAGPVAGDKSVPDCGWYRPGTGVIAGAGAWPAPAGRGQLLPQLPDRRRYRPGRCADRARCARAALPPSAPFAPSLKAPGRRAGWRRHWRGSRRSRSSMPPPFRRKGADGAVAA